MFAINPSTNDQDNADDPFIFTAGPDLDFANGLKGSQLETLPFSHFETGIYESYDESGPSSVQFADSNDFSERGGSHMSSKDEANGRSPANLDVMGANIKPTAEDHAGDDDPMFIDNVESESSPRSHYLRALCFARTHVTKVLTLTKSHSKRAATSD